MSKQGGVNRCLTISTRARYVVVASMRKMKNNRKVRERYVETAKKDREATVGLQLSNEHAPGFGGPVPALKRCDRGKLVDRRLQVDRRL